MICAASFRKGSLISLPKGPFLNNSANTCPPSWGMFLPANVYFCMSFCPSFLKIIWRHLSHFMVLLPMHLCILCKCEQIFATDIHCDLGLLDRARWPSSYQCYQDTDICLQVLVYPELQGPAVSKHLRALRV